MWPPAGATASADKILTQFSRNKPPLAPECLTMLFVPPSPSPVGMPITVTPHQRNVIASQITRNLIFVQYLFGLRTISNLHTEGNSAVADGIPLQRSINAESVSISWRHNVLAMYYRRVLILLSPTFFNTHSFKVEGWLKCKYVFVFHYNSSVRRVWRHSVIASILL